jgi:hypothetical protein
VEVVEQRKPGLMSALKNWGIFKLITRLTHQANPALTAALIAPRLM